MALTNGSDSESEGSSAVSGLQTTTSTSSATSPVDETPKLVQRPDPRPFGKLTELYTETVAAKIWRVAQELLEKDVSCLALVPSPGCMLMPKTFQNTLQEYPEYVPKDGPSAGRFYMKPAQF